MEIETTPWHETRTPISPQIEMVQLNGMIQYKALFLKNESPRTATIQKRFVHYDTNYIKYYFLKEFYQLLFDGVRQEVLKGDDNPLLSLTAEVVTDFIEYCREHPLAENAHELFRAFCKARLFKS
jgi:hypothetical protein